MPGDALAIEDISVPIDDQDIVGAIAVDIGHEGCGMRGGDELAWVHEGAVAEAQQHGDVA